MARTGGAFLLLLGIAGLVAIVLFDLANAFAAVGVTVPVVGALELDPGTAMITAAVFAVVVGVIGTVTP